jgi:N-acetylmuramoyl-L-alanine amidase
MKSLLYYLLQVIIASGILYSYYHFALRNKKFHRYNRFYLLAATVISITIPFLNIPVYFSQSETDSSFVLQTLTVISSPDGEPGHSTINMPSLQTNWFTWKTLSLIVYILISSLVLLRIFFSLSKIRRIIKANSVEQLDNICFINTDEPGTPFSFFRWLFWNKKIELQSEKGEQIFRHELFHIKQKHSCDIMYLELLTVLCWINPFFHLIKKEVKAIHEFLADQFAIKENKHWEYAELLLMQVLNTQQHLVNPFFHNQIKRRIAMITTSKKPSYQYLRKLMVLPVAAIVTGLFAFSYKSKNENFKFSVADKPFTVVIDAGHGGSDAGVIAADGTSEKNIVLNIAKKIKSLNEDANIKIILTREDDRFSKLKARSEITTTQNANLFLSLHIGSEDPMKEASKNGFEVFVSKKNNKYYSENKIWATILLNYFMQIHTTNNIINQRDAGIWVLDQADCPSALVECGYMTNSRDLNFIKQAESQEKIARSILMAIDQYAMQQKSADWQERKEKVSDTIKPVIQLEKNALTRKFEGTYDGRKIKEINTYGHPEQLVFIFENGDMVMISKEQSIEIRKKYGNDLEKNITKPFVKEEEKENREKIFSKVEIEPSFPGGEIKWKQYLKAALNKNTPSQKGAPAGTYTVVVQFAVKTDSTLTNIKALTNHGFGMEEEAIRIISKGPMWIPGLQNGKHINAIKNQPITFVIEKKDKRIISIINNSFPDPDNIIYIGAVNELSLIKTKYSLNEVSAVISNGGNIQRKKDKLVVTADYEGKLTVSLFAFEKNQRINLGNFAFQAKVLPPEYFKKSK